MIGLVFWNRFPRIFQRPSAAARNDPVIWVQVSVPQIAQENGTSVTKMSVPVTAEEKTNKKKDVNARSLLLML
ncbi:hypothetical protein Tco_0753703 [Tanacetum coccineum]